MWSLLWWGSTRLIERPDTIGMVVMKTDMWFELTNVNTIPCGWQIKIDLSSQQVGIHWIMNYDDDPCQKIGGFPGPPFV